MKLEEYQLCDLSNALLRLTGMKKNELAKQSGVNVGNVCGWMNNGTQHLLSTENQLKLLNTLGVRYGMLRRDIKHEWILNNDPSDIRLVMGLTSSKCDVFEPNNSEHNGEIRILSPMGGAEAIITVTRPLMQSPPVPISSLVGQYLHICKPVNSLQSDFDEKTIETNDSKPKMRGF